ncbi:MAG: FIST C-terminal domain-containing protein [Pirellulales bacterium]|nr:FIST C-terminal domain-containing protein [Pirellulales bacterium]
MADSPGALRAVVVVSTLADTADAVEQCTASALEQLGATPDLGVVFATHDHRSAAEELAAKIRARTGVRCLIGCTGESLACGELEFESGPALVLWLAVLPGVKLVPIHLSFNRQADGGAIVGWPDELSAVWSDQSALLVLGEPFSFPVELLLDNVSEQHPGVPVVGGMASGAHSPEQNVLWLDDQAHADGAVAVLVDGPVRLRPIVSQGCRPVGRTFVVTKAEQNVVQQLGGRPALEQLQEVYAGLSPDEQRQVQQGLHLGRVINEYQDRFERGDFLVRNVLGADPQSGAVAVGDYVRVGQTVQFHIRDAATADDDLRALLSAARGVQRPAGALLFTCNGRGTRLFESPHHDAATCQELLGPLPLAGFFAQGELGPVGGRNFIHGFTASVVLFEAARA